MRHVGRSSNMCDLLKHYGRARGRRVRMIPEDKPLLVSSATYLPIALKCAVTVSVIQIAAFYFVTTDAQAIFFWGWIAIFGCTTLRLWRLSTVALLSSELSLVKFLACIFAAGLGSAILYATFMASYAPGASNLTWRVKAAFISNPFAGLVIAALAAVATFIIEQVREILKARQ